MKLRIRELIQKHNESNPGDIITQEDVAKAIKVSPSVLSRYANGYVSGFKNEIVEGLLDYFNVSIEELYERVGKTA